MITAVDTSVLIDVFRGDVRFGHSSAERVRRAHGEGSVIACEIVWAEVAGAFPTTNAAHAAMTGLGVEFSGTDELTALAAGAAWKEYRRRGGQRERVIADFLIGAHAASHSDCLLTRDRGFYRAYFKGLRLFEPML